MPPPLLAHYRCSYRGTYELAVYLNRHQDLDHHQFLTLHLAGVRRPGTYALEEDTERSVISRSPPSHAWYDVSDVSFRTFNGRRTFLTGATARGQVAITRLDTVAGFVSGTFEATVQEDGGTELHRLNQGRFDAKF